MPYDYENSPVHWEDAASTYGIKNIELRQLAALETIASNTIRIIELLEGKQQSAINPDQYEWAAVNSYHDARRLRQKGYIVDRVYIDADDDPAWLLRRLLKDEVQPVLTCDECGAPDGHHEFGCSVAMKDEI